MADKKDQSDEATEVTSEDVMKFASGDDDASLGEISNAEPYKRRSSRASVVLPSGDTRDPIFKPWTKFTEALHHCILVFVVTLGVHAARHPKKYIAGCSFVAFALVIVGFFTNFKLELDMEVVFTPLGSRPAEHYEWIQSDAGFPNKVRNVALLFHRNGDDVLTHAAMERVFTAVNIVRSTPGYKELCAQGTYVDFEGNTDCKIMSATGYWYHHNTQVFLEETTTDEEVKSRCSNFTFANGAPVYHDAILGNWVKDDTGNLTSAQSYLVTIDIPDKEKEANEFEKRMLEALDQQRRKWMKADEETGEVVLNMDPMTIYAYEIEFMRAIQGDIYLIFVVSFLMCGFVALTMAKFGNAEHSMLKSRAILGMFAVYTVCMSYIAGNGLMFICGIPFTTVTQILPFVVVGIGLDDTFIITGEYFRTDPRIDTVERIRMTYTEVAHSISLTTITTILAFLMGLMSSLPGVRWLCLYAFVTIAIDFVFQITLFTGFIVVDENRIQAHRRDILCCLKTATHPDVIAAKKAAEGGTSPPDERSESKRDPTENKSRPSESGMSKRANGHGHRRGSVRFQDMHVVTEHEAMEMRKSEIGKLKAAGQSRSSNMSRHHVSVARRMSRVSGIFNEKGLPQQIMKKYADILMMPAVKALVLIVFGGFFGLCLWATSNLTQEFNLGDYVPTDSYLKDVLYTFENYASVIRPMAVYFRDIDQSDPAVQQLMIQYVEDLEALDQISGSIPVNLKGVAGYENITEIKPFCWVRDFKELTTRFADDPQYAAIKDFPFNLQLQLALSDPIVRELYGQDVIIDKESGNITGSRCWMFLSELDLNSIEAQLDMHHDQTAVTEVQPLNQNVDRWTMFFFDQLLFYWEAYDVAIRELIGTIVSGVVSLAILTVVLIPHWTATFIVTPMIMMTYINYLGLLQLMGMHINGIFYICVVVSIGLLVDFLMHVLLKYYECSPKLSRDDRVKETLETMGASILLGGLTTFLGVIPLVFSTTKIFFTVFLAFFAMVVLGLTHGLILMPVVLSLVGPKAGLAVHEDGVTTFDTEIGGPALHDDLVAELRAIEAEEIKRESVTAGEAVGVEAPVVDETMPQNVEPDGDEPDEPEEEAPPKRKTLTDVMV